STGRSPSGPRWGAHRPPGGDATRSSNRDDEGETRSLGFRRGALTLHEEVRLDERRQIAVQHRVDAGLLEARAVIVDLAIGLQHVRADLAPPLDALLLALDLRHLGFASLLLACPQACLEHAHRSRVVLDLRTLRLT